MVLFVRVQVAVVFVFVVDRGRLLLRVNITHAFPVVWRVLFVLLDELQHPLRRAVLREVLHGHRESGLSVDPVAVVE